MNDTKRLPRLTAILTQLQTKRLITAPELAARFEVSVRTIYRDIRSLEQAGIPIMTEEGKGYQLMEHYRIPPVMFTESEANALILAEQLVLKNKANLLAERTRFSQNINNERTSNNLSTLQFALTNFLLAKIDYTNEAKVSSTRIIQPFALLSTEGWLLVAWCTLRKDFRYFRLDRIQKLEILTETFTPHKMTLQEFFDSQTPG